MKEERLIKMLYQTRKFTDLREKDREMLKERGIERK